MVSWERRMKNEGHAPPPAGRKKKGEGQQRRIEILDAAKQLFVEQGYNATTIRRIASRVGISSTGLYVYFPDKNAILAEICEATFESLIEELDEVRRKSSDPLRALQESLEGYIRFGLSHPNEYELVFLSRHTQELQRTEVRNEKLGMQAFQRFSECVEAVVQTGLTQDADTERLTQQLWAGIHGLVALLLLHPDFCWVDLDSLISGQVTMLIRGVTRRG
jgi:AcrR family transcriptional regulator